MQVCMLSQPALADWKANSIYKSDSWRIERTKCVPGDYCPRSAFRSSQGDWRASKGRPSAMDTALPA